MDSNGYFINDVEQRFFLPQEISPNSYCYLVQRHLEKKMQAKSIIAFNTGRAYTKRFHFSYIIMPFKSTNAVFPTVYLKQGGPPGLTSG